MTTTDLRSELGDVTAAAGWARRIDDRVDIYVRGQTRVRVIWQGNDAISGGSRFQDDNMETYSRDLETVKGWLAR
jgi:Lon protease-like protein